MPRSLEILAGAERVTPPCVHFGVCGGCSFQHVALSVLHEWKRGEIRRALAAHGIGNVDVAETIAVPPRSRRRAVLTARRAKDGVTLGFMEHRSHDVVAITECHVLDSKIVVALPGLRTIAMHALPEGVTAGIAVLLTASGLDACIQPQTRLRLDAALRQHLAGAAAQAGLARLALGGDIIAELRKPVVEIAGVPVTPPPEAFLQPTMEGERALQNLVRGAVGGAKRVADLFAGCGTFTLALARRASVHALDSAADHLEALSLAARHAQGLKPVTSERRDLFRRPFAGEELARFDAVVMNPPRAGAKAQSEALAPSRVPCIAYVSCDPASFARDAKILIDGGYHLGRVTPVDQFLWSPHAELVAVFRR